MKHANADSLPRLERLLVGLRSTPGITEKSAGIFYRKSTAFVHFHKDGEELFADIKLGKGWTRVCVTSDSEQREALRFIQSALDNKR